MYHPLLFRRAGLPGRIYFYRVQVHNHPSMRVSCFFIFIALLPAPALWAMPVCDSIPPASSPAVDSSVFYLEKGIAFLRNGKAAEALLQMDRSLAFDSLQRRAWEHRGQAALALGKYGEARRDLLRARELGAGGAELHRDLALAAHRDGDPDAALEASGAALRMGAGDPELRLIRGSIAFDHGEWQTAADELGVAIGAGLDAPQVRAQRGLALYELGRFADCTADLSAAIGRETAPPAEWVRKRGLACSKTGDHQAALPDLNAAYAAGERGPEVLLARARALYETGDFAAAAVAWTEVLESGAGDAEALLKRGLSYYRSDKPVEALTDFEAVLLAEPGQALARQYRGYINFAQGNWLEALPDLLFQARGSSAGPEDYARTGTAAYHTGDSLTAWKYLDLALSRGLLETALYRMRGISAFRLGRYEAAVSDLDRAGEPDAEILLLRGTALYRLGHYRPLPARPRRGRTIRAPDGFTLPDAR
jgi:tetratricopeptide (TPR) repeat protein